MLLYIIVILKSLTLRFQPNLTSFYWSPFSFCFFSPSPSSSAFPSVSSLSSSAGRGGAGFPAQKLVSFWEESEDLIWGWNQLLCHLIQEGKTQAKEEDLYASTILQLGGTGRRAPKEGQSGLVLGITHQGSPKDRGPLWPSRVGVLGSGPGCPGDLSITVVSSRSASGTPGRPCPTLSKCSLLDSWLCRKGNY